MRTSSTPLAPIGHAFIVAARRLRSALLPGLLALLAGCSDPEPIVPAAANPDGLETLTLRYQGSVGSVTYPELAEALGYLAPVRLEWIGNTISGPQDIQAVMSGDVEFGGAFNGAIIKLVAARAPITAVIGYYGVDEVAWQGFYVLDGSAVRAPRDLIGRSVAVNTIGAHSEFMLREYLARSGLTADEARQVTLVVVPPINGEQVLRQQQVDVATLGGVLRDKALERGGLRKLFSDHDLYGNFTAGSIVFRDDFIAANPRTVRHFVTAMARAIEWARTTPTAQVQARMREIIARRGRNEDDSLVRYFRSTSVPTPGGVLSAAEFAPWIAWLEKDGQLPPGKYQPTDFFDSSFHPEGAGQRGVNAP